jgi:YVTN family beta-propeller protein
MITGKVMRIDASTDSVIDYVDVGTAPIGITIAQNKAYVACAISGEVWVVDVTTGAVLNTLTNVGLIPVDVCTNQAQDKVYVANAVSGDISVIDVATDMVVDTLPAGLPLAGIFQQLGLTIPSSAQGGLGGVLNNFLQGFTTGLANPGSFGNLLFGGQSGGGLLSPGALVNGLLTAFLGFAGINTNLLNGLNLPAIGLMSLSVAHDPDLICGGNAFLGQLVTTEESTKTVNAMTGLTGLGPVDVTTIVPR